MILVTAATGQVGRETTRALVEDRQAVRALVRDASTTDALAGAEIVQATFEDRPALTRAMTGVDVVLLAGRDNPDQVAQHDNVLDAAARAGVRHVVKLSALGASTESPIELMRHHGVGESRLRDSGMNWTIARPHLFLQNLLRAADALRATGVLRAPLGDHRVPLVDTRDVAAALAGLLASPGEHAGAVYTLTGPTAVAYADVAAALGRLIGQPITYEAVAPRQLADELKRAGVPARRADDLAFIARAYGPEQWGVRPDLRALLGRAPRSLEAFLIDHRATFIC